MHTRPMVQRASSECQGKHTQVSSKQRVRSVAEKSMQSPSQQASACNAGQDLRMEAMTNIPGISRGLAVVRMHKVLYDPLPRVMEIKTEKNGT